MHHVIGKKIDVWTVTETWLRDEDSVALAVLSSQGYSFRNVSREADRRGGGTGILVRDDIKIRMVNGEEKRSFGVSE